MNTKKSRLFTYFFGLCPGAGHMYLGLMKKGTLLMSLFFGIFAFGTFFGLAPILIILPVIWFYSFFDVINLYPLSDERRAENEANFFKGFGSLDMDNSIVNAFFDKRGLFIGWALILFGGYMVFDNVIMDLFLREFIYSYPIIRDIYYRIPTMVLAVVLFYFGFKLVRGPKPAPKDDTDDYKEFDGHDK